MRTKDLTVELVEAARLQAERARKARHASAALERFADMAGIVDMVDDKEARALYGKLEVRLRDLATI